MNGTIQVGDTVQLTGSTMLRLSQDAPEVFQRLSSTQRAGGQVTSVDTNSVSIDIGEATPLIIEFAPDMANMSVQLVQKATVPPAVPQPAEDDAPPPPEGAGPCAGAPQIYAFPFNQAPPFIQSLLGGRMQPEPQPRDDSPRLKMATWAVTQFMDLKKYGIVQDLNRTSDEHAKMPDPTGEPWKKEYRPVQVELTAPEEQLYNTALRTIQEYLAPPTVGVTKPVHPEVAADDTPVNDESVESPPSE